MEPTHEPRSMGRARWPLVAGLSLLLFAAGVGLAMTGAVTGVAAMAVSGVGALVAVVTVGGGGWAMRRGRWREGLVTIGVAAAPTAWAVALIVALVGHPRVNDVTTDPSLTVAGMAPPTAMALAAGRDHYPDIAPLTIAQPVADVHVAVSRVVAGAGWLVVSRDMDAGVWHVAAETGVFRFVDDVLIRVHSVGDHARVDVRSRSRVGKSDLGVNAARIRSFMRALSSELAAPR